MNAVQRREVILERLSNANAPVSASVLAAELGVSRQIVVGDVALLRAGGAAIEATPRGYQFHPAPGGYTGILACVHRTAEEMRTELYAVVDQGGTVVDVAVENPLYGELRGNLNLSSRLEDKLIADILASVSAVELHPVRTEALTRELFRAFVQNKTAVNILFADSRQGIFANRIEKGLRERLTAQDPTFANDPKRGILLSFCVQGCFYAFTNNSSRMDEKHLVDLLAEIARAAQKIKM